MSSLRARLTRTTAVLTAGSVVAAGAVALVLTVRATRADTEGELRREAQTLVLALAARAPAGSRIPVRRLERELAKLRVPLRLDGAEILALRHGVLERPVLHQPVATVAGGLGVAVLDPTALAAGRTVAGHRGSLVFAAAPFVVGVRAGAAPASFAGVVVLTRFAPSGLGAALPGLLVASVVVVAVAVVAADRLSRRILRPLDAARDVTARMSAGDLEARVPVPADADTEVAALAASINQMGAEIGEARRAQRQFFLSVSHDLRTPLTAIRGFAEALEDGTETDAARAGAVIASESRRLERLVQDLLELGRLELRQFSLRTSPVLLGEAAVAVGEAFAPAAAEVGVTLQVVDDGAGRVLADPDRLAQVLANLVENALDHARTCVLVHAAGAAVSVDDDGPGIEPALLPRVLEPFTGAGAARPRRLGTGLGLAIVNELVRSMGGHVQVASPLGPSGGTRVSVGLPAAPEA
jgi:signal transduction histidine kinase